MSDEMQAVQEDAAEVVDTEAEQVEASEAAENTEGPEQTRSAEEPDGDNPDDESSDLSRNQRRRATHRPAFSHCNLNWRQRRRKPTAPGRRQRQQSRKRIG